MGNWCLVYKQKHEWLKENVMSMEWSFWHIIRLSFFNHLLKYVVNHWIHIWKANYHQYTVQFNNHSFARHRALNKSRDNLREFVSRKSWPILPLVYLIDGSRHNVSVTASWLTTVPSESAISRQKSPRGKSCRSDPGHVVLKKQ